LWLCESYHCKRTAKNFQSDKCAAQSLRRLNRRLTARAAGRAATVNRLIDDLQSDGEVFCMIATALEKVGCCHGHDMSSTPPMFYDDAIYCAILERLNRRACAKSLGRATTAKRLAEIAREEKEFRRQAVIQQGCLARQIRGVADDCEKLLGEFAHANPIEVVVFRLVEAFLRERKRADIILADQRAAHRLLDAAGVGQVGTLGERIGALVKGTGHE
jgi:hypothetical protein